MVILFLFIIALPFSAGTAFATTNVTSSQNTSANNNLANVTDQNSTSNLTETTTTKNTNLTNKAAGSPNASNITKTTNSNSKNIAAGSAGSTTPKFTNAELTNAAARVQSFVNTNYRLPNYVTISNTEVTMSEFLQLLVKDLINYNSGLNSAITINTVNNPTNNTTDTVETGNILKSQYLNIANSMLTFINANGRAPNYANTTLGQMNFDNLVYSFSKIVNFIGTNQRLPNYVSVESWSFVTNYIPASLDEYLQPTTNCQSNSPTIIALANKITANCTSPYEKAVALFNWVTDNITYSFYYNTKYGALGTLAAGTANCCDHSHLMVALARAAGIPARYQLGNCDFYGTGGGWYGHVWAQLYVNGTWYYADTISTLNTFGVINNWNLSTYTLEGTYTSLPF